MKVGRWRAGGNGCYRPLCTRAVLDANCFRGSSERELAALRERGFALSVSIEGLREVWARSLRDDKYDHLRTRIRLVAKYLDGSAPVAFVGRALFSTIGQTTPEIARSSADFRSSIDRAWRAIREQGLPPDEWSRIGRELNDELGGEEEWWLQQVQSSLALDARVDLEIAKHGPFYDKARAWGLFRREMAAGANVRTTPPIATRIDAHLSYLTDKLQHARARQPSGNDYCDGRQLMHLAWPAFLVTADLKLIDTVDRASPSQCAWVRTPVELVEDKVVRCAPWGRAAVTVAQEFRRQPRRDLAARLERWRAALKAAT